MASEQNILIKVTGEADLTDAQLQLREMTNRSKELEKQMAELDAQQRQDANDLKASIQGEKELSAALKQNAQYYGNLKGKVQEAINANTKSISTLKQQVSAMNAVNNSGGKLAMQIRAIREQLAQMEMAGDTSSQAFVDLSVQAAKLQDQMGDTSKQISILASDTKNLDAAMSVGQGIAGAFNVATAAAALFGGESEELNEAFLKVQASLAVLNGVQQVANTLNKDSAANVVIRTALQKLFNREKAKETAATTAAATAATADTAAKGAQTVATTAATKATWSLNAALLANPVLLIVAGVAALAAGLVYLFKCINDSAEAQRNFNGIMKETQKTIADSEEATGYAARLAEAEGKSWQEVAKIEEKGLQAQMNEAGIAYNKMLKMKKEADGDISDEEQQMMDDLLEIYQTKRKELEKARQDYHIREVADQTKQNEEKLRQEEEYQKQRIEQIKAAEKQLQDVRIALMQDSTDKEIAKINLDFDRKIADIKGNSDTEIELRKALEAQRSQEIQRVRDQAAQDEMEQENEIARLKLENTLANAENEGNNLYEIRAEVLEGIAQLEISAVEQSTDTEEMKAEKIRAIAAKLKADLAANAQERAQDEIDQATQAASIRIKEEENAAIRILNSETATAEQRRAAMDTLMSHEANTRNIRLQELQAQKDAMLITEQEYQDAKLDIEREALEEEAMMMDARKQQTQELAQQVLQFVGDMASEIFGAISDGIQQQIEDLDNMYTTDAEEAKEDANKKYITEKELENKKLELKRKQAVADKASAAFSIALNTAMAIMRIWADVPKADFGATTIALTAMTAALGATQLAMVLAKPLPKYAKGRAGGKGEYALVGERGPELMYVPEGASIVPNNKLSMPKEWVNYGLPRQPHFMGPTMDDTARTTMAMQLGLMAIDYDRLGKAVADNIPAQKAVHVNVDRRGVTIDDGADQHTYLNKKYTGQWT